MKSIDEKAQHATTYKLDYLIAIKLTNDGRNDSYNSLIELLCLG